MELPVGRYQAVDPSKTLSHNQREVMIKYVAIIPGYITFSFGPRHEDIIFHPREAQWLKSVPLRILSFDIETNVPENNQFTPYHQTAEMPVIQIGNEIVHGLIFLAIRYTWLTNTPLGERSFRGVFTLGECTKIDGAQVYSFPNEVSMLRAWKEFIIASDPDLITGHNIARFDFVYLIFRAEVLGLQDFSCLGRLKGNFQHKVWRNSTNLY